MTAAIRSAVVELLDRYPASGVLPTDVADGLVEPIRLYALFDLGTFPPSRLDLLVTRLPAHPKE